MKLVSAGFIEGFITARVWIMALRQHHEELIALSACLSVNCRAAVDGLNDEALKHVALMQDIFSRTTISSKSWIMASAMKNRAAAPGGDVGTDRCAAGGHQRLPLPGASDATAQEVLMCIKPAKRWRMKRACAWKPRLTSSPSRRCWRCSPTADAVAPQDVRSAARYAD